MKTAVIFTGGTIASTVKNGVISTDRIKKYAVLDAVSNADFEIFEPYTILSENLNADTLNMLLKSISSAICGRYDGIIVCHGTDTLQYSACACAYAFGSDTIPIVFVSSNYILEDKRANGRINFKYAYDFIKNISAGGTFISYKNAGENPKIHRAARVMQHCMYDDGIKSLGGEYGEYINGRFYKNPSFSESGDETEPIGICDFTASGAIKLNAYPNMRIPETNLPLLLETYHSGTACEEVIKNIHSEVYLTGIEDRIQYASTLSYNKPNIHILRRAAAPAMYMKLWMCGCAGRLSDINLTISSDFYD